MKRWPLALLTMLAAWAFVVAAKADSVADFYHGKRIAILISTEAGSGYDLYARLLASHLGNYIPGNPSIVAENEPGAGGMTVANAVTNTQPHDGTVMFTLHFTLPLYQAMGGQGVRFDAKKFIGIGRLLASNVVIGVMRNSKSGVTNIDDAMSKESAIGSTGLTSNATIYPVILNNMLHTKFKIVPGYRGEGDVFLALQRGEIDGFGSYSYLTFKSVHPDYLTKKLFYPIVQWGAKREEEWSDIPTAIDLAKTPTDKEAMAIVSAGSDIGFSYFLPPDVPADRVAAIRHAFDDMVKDPAFLADAQKSNMFLRPASGPEVEKMVRDVLGAPVAAVDRATALMSADGTVPCAQYPNNDLCKTRNSGDPAEKAEK
ncbi:MAG TPA: hypothetical protein VG271_11190 [Beijerinckiaceae bacterium]|jgi:tripartite-type tricarboxylate transporter receptor subunit TctC|nr:hypothetical protein [Beijerinckiaceae bacterium]